MSESESDELWTPSDSAPAKSLGKKKKKKKKLYKCGYEGCSAVFYRPGRLANHVSVHKGQRRFRCEVVGCSKAYSSFSHLKRHSIKAHSSDQPDITFPCSIMGCKKVLKTRDILMKHIKRAHGERLFTCQICSRDFRAKDRLKAHLHYLHNNQDSHQCEKCNLVFAKMSQYHRHMRRHRLHICPQVDCYFTCEEYQELRKHTALTHPYLFQCYYCGKKMRNKYQTRVHVRFHLARQGLVKRPPPVSTTPIPCSLCSTALATKGSLKRHMLAVHSSLPKTKKPVKKGSERARRRDKGVPRRSTASRLASVEIPASLNRELISKNEHSTNDETSSRILELTLPSWINTEILTHVDLSSSSGDGPPLSQ